MEISLTFGTNNLGPRLGPIVISEIQYHPIPGGDEFVELMNTSDNTVPLYDLNFPTNAWKIGGIGYTFPLNVSLGPAQLLLVVPISPGFFRLKYNVPAAVQIYGPYPGVLDDAGERVTLQAPDTPNPVDVPYVVVEEIHYDHEPPWPASADGGGVSLQRRSPLAFGNDPTNWTAATQTPGQLSQTQDTDGDGLPDWWEIAHGTNWKVPDADADSDHDGMSNWQEFLAGTDPQDPQSRLLLNASLMSPGSVNLQFVAASNHSYSIIYKNSLQDLSWSKFVDVPARETNWISSVLDATDATNRFYRLVTPVLP
jgi:hypothetical protein